MKQKLNKAGKMQNYDSKGRYAKNSPIEPAKPKITKKQKHQLMIQRRDEELLKKAKNSKDPYIKEVGTLLVKMFPGEVLHINWFIIDKDTQVRYEQDIITSSAIIEVKGGQVGGCSKQFAIQKHLAEQRHKKHLVFAPNITTAREREYTRQGFTIIKTYTLLLKIMEDIIK